MQLLTHGTVYSTAKEMGGDLVHWLILTPHPASVPRQTLAVPGGSSCLLKVTVVVIRGRWGIEGDVSSTLKES